MFTSNRKVFSFSYQWIFTFTYSVLNYFAYSVPGGMFRDCAYKFFFSKVFMTTYVIFSNVWTTPHQWQGALFPRDIECYFFATESFYIQFYFESNYSLNLHISGINLLRIPNMRFFNTKFKWIHLFILILSQILQIYVTESKPFPVISLPMDNQCHLFGI